MTAEIIDFRTGKKKTLEQSQRSDKEVEQDVRKFANDMVDDYMVRLIHEWQHEGLNIGSTEWSESKRTFKELGFFIEVLRALIQKEFELYHPMQEVMNKMMKLKYDKNKNKYYSQISYPVKREKTVEFEGEELE